MARGSAVKKMMIQRKERLLALIASDHVEKQKGKESENNIGTSKMTIHLFLYETSQDFAPIILQLFEAHTSKTWAFLIHVYENLGLGEASNSFSMMAVISARLPVNRRASKTISYVISCGRIWLAFISCHSSST